MSNYDSLGAPTHADNPDTRDWLFSEEEAQAARYNRLRAYQPTSRDVARAYVAAGERTNAFWAALKQALASLGWL